MMCAEPEMNGPTIIYLRGPSSSGKTQIAEELQEQLPDFFLRFALDTIFDGFPKSVLRRKWEGQDLSDIRCPSVGRGYHACVHALAGTGFNLIIDDDLPDDVVGTYMADIIETYNVILIGVHCPLDELTKRESQRHDRTVGSAKRGVETIREGIEYDLVIDSSQKTPDQAAGEIARFLQGHPRYPRRSVDKTDNQ